MVPDARAIINRLLPARMRTFLMSYRRLERSEQKTLLHRRCRRMLGLHDDQRRQLSPAARRFVFTCYGNIMRSPLSEALFRQYLKGVARDVAVVSAGLSATPGQGADPRALKVAHEFGVSLEGHRAQVLTPEMVQWADVVFAMDFENEAQFVARHPEAIAKLAMLGWYADSPAGKVEIPDPYWGDEEDVRRCYTILQGCIRNLVDSLFGDSVGCPKSEKPAASPSTPREADSGKSHER